MPKLYLKIHVKSCNSNFMLPGRNIFTTSFSLYLNHCTDLHNKNVFKKHKNCLIPFLPTWNYFEPRDQSTSDETFINLQPQYTPPLEHCLCLNKLIKFLNCICELYACWLCNQTIFFLKEQGHYWPKNAVF